MRPILAMNSLESINLMAFIEKFSHSCSVRRQHLLNRGANSIWNTALFKQALSLRVSFTTLFIRASYS